ncbi:MAG TPA: DNA polymerase III subunit gamma/tau [Candidatus Peribacteraceae bacterium]|nr:DNA polymerase III subunit gamma/tau [Candidatus Peribacteraceae bacterium]
MALYRKYRPQSFNDVVGQDHIVTTLQQAAEQDKLAHAYLFAGSRGTGKTSVARILAKILMIKGVEDETLQKQIVRGVEEGSIVDLLEIDAASNRGIDDIRSLVEKIQFSPVVASAKVYIIDEVHMLTKEAFNALLKTLEEPPPYAFFILATTELNKIPSTIQSRCQCFPFRAIREEDIIQRLQFIADQEGIVIDRDALRSIAHHVEGGLRDAISLLDQMRSLKKISLAEVQERIGGVGHEYIDDVFAALQEKDTEALLQTVSKLEENGVPTENFLRLLLAVIRKRLHEAVENKKPTKEIVRVLDILLNALRDLRISPIPALVLESALFSICNRDEKAEQNEELFAVEEKKEETSAKKPTEKEKRKAEKKKGESVEEEKKEEAPSVAKPEETASPDAIVEAREVSLESMQEVWGDIVDDTHPPSVKMSLKNGRLAAVMGTKVTIAFSSSFHRDTVAKAEASHTVEEVMERLFKRHLRLECVLDQGQNDEESGTEEHTVNLAEAAAEIF